ncbi:hypothetical protein F7R91_08325 [Streptomyces luteolifulvus]|uniref:Uncharacterized protein n=1 Tax=Streptomyces luteolifulvus TaxID=2615112 RepID=A0A6H9V539_9ACTN|nr:hypothetical protein F7R91_08325 [Streptomyces luteolifulvus]
MARRTSITPTTVAPPECGKGPPTPSVPTRRPRGSRRGRAGVERPNARRRAALSTIGHSTPAEAPPKATEPSSTADRAVQHNPCRRPSHPDKAVLSPCPIPKPVLPKPQRPTSTRTPRP